MKPSIMLYEVQDKDLNDIKFDKNIDIVGHVLLRQ